MYKALISLGVNNTFHYLYMKLIYNPLRYCKGTLPLKMKLCVHFIPVGGRIEEKGNVNPRGWLEFGIFLWDRYTLPIVSSLYYS